MKPKCLLVGLLLILSLSDYLFSQAPRESPADPSFVLWVWDRPEDLSFLEPGEATLAYLCGTISLEGNVVSVAPRRGMLVYHHAIERVAVIRIETSREDPPALGEEQLKGIVDAVFELAPPATAPRLQIDFDAALSQRSFYRDLIHALRKGNPRLEDLSITALGSWCLGDRWFNDLPVDSAVAMLFRMGPGAAGIRSSAAGRRFPEKYCVGRVGLATDEPWVVPDQTGEVWFFHPRAWDEFAWEEVKSRWNAGE